MLRPRTKPKTLYDLEVVALVKSDSFASQTLAWAEYQCDHWYDYEGPSVEAGSAGSARLLIRAAREKLKETI